MSHQVQIDYQGVAIQCQSVCELAEARLKELDEMLVKVQASSSSLMNDRATELVKAIEKERDDLLSQFKAVREQAEVQAKNRNNSITGTLANARTLQQSVDRLSSKKLIEFESLLHTLLDESVNNEFKRIHEQSRGIVAVDSYTQQLIDSISDTTLKQFTYLAFLQDNTLSGERLLAAGKLLMEKAVSATYESRYEAETAKIRAELEAAKVDALTVKKITEETGDSAKEKFIAMREAATQEIIGEKVRQKSLRIIMKAIQERGFIVDKKNIKIKRDTNEVVLVALKASGEKAEFRVFLDGKFMYDFRGYEGQACQKDIEPFMRDLEEIYGIKVTNQTEIWSNPDKISTMKYQAMNTNKNKN